MVSDKSNVDSIFLAAVELPPDRRSAYLNDVCGHDSELRARVERLIAAQSHVDSFLESPAPELGATPGRIVTERPGIVIGPYKLLEQIGEGGFGVVFLAEQATPIRRRVALKLIKPGMDTRQVLARFEAERQALALMDHPGIAKVFDAGVTEQGRSYFVMELVAGVPINEYCDECNLPTRERLALFIAVCQAAQHAHQNGVIHRDLKPTNVLVALQDGRPATKIIDFGVAKAIAEPLTEHSMMSAFAPMVGTPLYMSPEQAELSRIGVDTRSDVYSLGVMLYELLTGTTPFEKERLHTAPFDELRRIIREEEPPRPSARISTLAADLATTVAEHRRSNSRRLKQQMHGDLDWIVMKCLEKDRSRRYDSASALAADVRRYLNDEPVIAGPPSRLYRANKFVRRNKGPVFASAAVFMGLVAGIIGVTIGLVIQSRQRAIAERERAEAQFNLAAALQQQDRNNEAEALYRQALAAASGDAPEDRQRAARTLLRLAQVVGQRSNAAESEPLYRQALAAHRVAFASGDANIALPLTSLAMVVRGQQRWAEAESLFREAYEINRQSAPIDHRVIGRSAAHLGHAISMQGRYAEAEPLIRESIDQYRLAIPPDEWSIALAQVELGRALHALGRRLDAEVQLLEAARVLESTGHFGYAVSALAGFYASWDESEPGKGHDAQAREWLFKLTKGYIHSEAAAVEPRKTNQPRDAASKGE